MENCILNDRIAISWANWDLMPEALATFVGGIFLYAFQCTLTCIRIHHIISLPAPREYAPIHCVSFHLESRHPRNKQNTSPPCYTYIIFFKPSFLRRSRGKCAFVVVYNCRAAMPSRVRICTRFMHSFLQWRCPRTLKPAIANIELGLESLIRW
jgi:hypothetical protein